MTPRLIKDHLLAETKAGAGNLIAARWASLAREIALNLEFSGSRSS